MSAFTHTTPHFSDAIFLLPLIASNPISKSDAKKIAIGYTAGALFTLLFLAVFFGTFSAIAPREHYAFAKIAQYFPALSVVGRIDLIFIYLLTIVLLFYTCLPLQYATDLLSKIFHTNRRVWISATLSLLAFLFILFANHFYNSIYTAITRWSIVFWLFADLSIIPLLLLPKIPKKESFHA